MHTKKSYNLALLFGLTVFALSLTALFVGSRVIAGNDHVTATESDSVELGLLELSPSGEAGGYAMPASGCAVVHSGTVTDCEIVASLDGRKQRADGTWGDYHDNRREIYLGQEVQLRWDTTYNNLNGESGAWDSSQVTCVGEIEDPNDSSRTFPGSDFDTGGARTGNDQNIVEPDAAGEWRNYFVNCSYYNLSDRNRFQVRATSTPTVELELDDNPVVYGDSTNLRWYVMGADTCTASGDWSGSKDPSFGVESTGQILDGNGQTYTLTCSNAMASASETVTLAVDPPPAPTINLSASPNPIAYDTSSTLTWTVSGYIQSCGTDAGPWPGSSDLGTSGGTRNTGNLTTDTYYRMQCIGPEPWNIASTDDVTVDVIQPPEANLNVCRWDGSSATDCATDGETLLIADGDEVRVIWDGGPEPSTACTETGGKDFVTGGLGGGAVTVSSLTISDSPETYGISCSNISGTETASVDVIIGTLCDPGDGVIAPEVVRAGAEFTVEWQKPVDVATCTLTGGGISVTNPPSTTDGCDINVEFPVSIENRTAFTLMCDYPAPPDPVVDVIPRTEEI